MERRVNDYKEHHYHCIPPPFPSSCANENESNGVLSHTIDFPVIDVPTRIVAEVTRQWRGYDCAEADLTSRADWSIVISA
jgi:hypothetical protein